MFQFQYVIGRGGYGKVWKVLKKNVGVNYAIKEMSKVQVFAKHCEKAVLNEREILSQLKHPYPLLLSHS